MAKDSSRERLARREAILSTSIEYLAEVGPSQFESKEVANRCGITQSQINYYFGGRDGLLMDAMTTLHVRHSDEIIERVEGQADPYEGMLVYVDTVIDFVTTYGATSSATSIPELFARSEGIETWRREANAAQVLDSSERVSTVLVSACYSIWRGRPYRRMNRAKIGVVALTNPRVTNSVVLIGMSCGGLARVWTQHLARPTFGFDPRKLLRRSARMVLDDLRRSPQVETDETDYYDDDSGEITS